MAEIRKLYTPEDYLELLGLPVKNRDIAIVNFDELEPIEHFPVVQVGYYAVFFHPDEHIPLSYGHEQLQFGEGTLIFMAPGQIISPLNTDVAVKTRGYALVFSTNAIEKTPLAKSISTYTFFNYEVNEALITTHEENYIISELIERIAQELTTEPDALSHDIIAWNIELLLKYCQRFFNRQFEQGRRKNLNLLEEFEHILTTYFFSDKPRTLGLPTVAYIAQQMHLSPNYFGDLVKRETGTSPQEFIQATIVNIAKSLVFDPQKTINDIAESLGFKHPQHFSTMFKRRTGMTPTQYRQTLSPKNK